MTVLSDTIYKTEFITKPFFLNQKKIWIFNFLIPGLPPSPMKSGFEIYMLKIWIRRSLIDLDTTGFSIKIAFLRETSQVKTNKHLNCCA